jgi:hypothetical protein
MQPVLSLKTGLLSQLWHRFLARTFFGRTCPKAFLQLDHVWMSARGEPSLSWLPRSGPWLPPGVPP